MRGQTGNTSYSCSQETPGSYHTIWRIDTPTHPQIVPFRSRSSLTLLRCDHNLVPVAMLEEGQSHIDERWYFTRGENLCLRSTGKTCVRAERIVVENCMICCSQSQIHRCGPYQHRECIIQEYTHMCKSVNSGILFTPVYLGAECYSPA